MKQKSRAVLIALSVVLLLLIAGCGKKEDKISKDNPFLGGTKGLEIGFLKDSPPDEITDNNLFPFRVVLSVKNEGEIDLQADQVRVDLKGILHTDFGLLSKDDITNQRLDQQNEILTSRKKDSEGNIIEPVEVFVTIPKDKDLLLGENKISGNTEFLFRADVCYQYNTNVISKICVLENMITVADDAICNPREEKRVFSSSSPVKVTSLRQTVAGENKIQFSFDITHVGSGKVFESKKPTSIGVGCPKDLVNIRKEEDKVKVSVTTGIADTLTCVGVGTGSSGSVNGDVKLVNDKRTITCTQEISQRADLERNVDIKLGFDYSDSADKRILAKHLKDITGVAPPVQPLPTGGGLKTCGASDAPPDTKCIPKTTQFQKCSDLQSCSDASLICTCSSTSVACSGACTSITGQDVTGPTIGGRIHPDFAVSGIDQFFVVNDVSDPSGVVSCKLVDFAEKEFILAPQGPTGCLPGNPCDFVGTVRLDAQGPLSVVCADAAGNKNADKKTRIIIVKQKMTQADQVPQIAAGGVGPEFGDVVTDIVVRDINTFIIVTGIHDKKSGIKSCTLIAPSNLDQPTGTKSLQGPEFNNQKQCFGEKADNFNMPCTFSQLIKIPSTKAQSGAIPAYKIQCTSGTNVVGEAPVPILVR